MGVLLQAPLADIIGTTIMAVPGITALAAGTGGWLFARLTPAARVAADVARVALLFGSLRLEPFSFAL
jgi:TRAP-type uncharacterized transport system fused permease subunit